MDDTEFAEQLRERGLRVTSTRLATLRAVQDNPHSSADVLVSLVREDLGTASKQAVYDILHVLTDVGLLRRIQPGGRAALYECETKDNHHHFHCDSCGKVLNVACLVGSAPCMAPPATDEFHVRTADVVYRGLCAACHKAQEERATPTVSTTASP